MRRGFLVGVGVAVVVPALVLLAPLLWFAKKGGAERSDVTLPGGIPGTLYTAYGENDIPAPVVVVAHGYSGDRTTMSSLARSLAHAGYGVLTIDLSGFGENPNGYGEGDRAADVTTAIEWLVGDAPGADASIALLGHSMGGHAVLDVARRDERVDATVVLGASGSTAGIRNALVMFGERESAPPGVERIDGANHISVLWSDETVARTVAWLNEIFGDQGVDVLEIQDSRLSIALLYLGAAGAALPLLGVLAGRIVRRSRDEEPPRLRDAALVGGALAIGVPVGGLVDPARALGPGYGDVVSCLAVAGVVLLLPRLRRHPVVDGAAERVAHAAVAAVVATLGAFVLFAPLNGVVHRLIPTAPRLGLAAVMAPFFALFFVQLQGLLRRGSAWRAAAASVLAHAMILVALAAGVVLDVFPGVVALALPLLAGLFALVELFAAGAYVVTRNGAFVGLVEALWVAAVAAVAMPLPG